MRDSKEVVEDVEFVQKLEGGGMDRITAKDAEEILVFLENGDLMTGSGQ